jgi:glutamyl endopeptidase
MMIPVVLAGTALAILATLGAIPRVGVAQTSNRHGSQSNITVRVPIRPSTAPESEPPFEVGSSDQTVIIGPDDERKPVADLSAFPFRAVVSILADGSSCSGWLYGADVVATAGHCIHKKGRWSSKVTVRTANWPYQTCDARALFTTVGWALDEDERYDYGSIKLACKMGTTAGWLGYGWGRKLLARMTTTVIGFSAGRDGKPQLYTSPGAIDGLLDGQVFYSNDTGEQTSGAPVIALRACARCAVAIHTKPTHDAPKPHSTSNHGTLISREVFENLRAWKELH